MNPWNPGIFVLQWGLEIDYTDMNIISFHDVQEMYWLKIAKVRWSYTSSAFWD